jgi:putative flippase GtrA
MFQPVSLRRMLSSSWPALASWARQLHRYTVTGGAVFALDVFTYWVIVEGLESWFLYAHFISRTLGGIACFLLNRYVTFKKREGAGFLRDLVRFAILYGVSFALSTGLVYVNVEWLSLGTVGGKVVAECTVFLFNYTVMKYWVMKPSGESST